MTVCAFLNQGGGQVLFGVTPDGAVAGQQVSERTIKEEVRACLPGGSESMPASDWQQALPEEKANWVGFRGYFRTGGDIDKFLSLVER